ncbi:hypothetical protein ASPVEDRAFT_87303 [Aspergillus versicolor CBS 583.65]|uniref:MYND-type domain-containing protein n=1 Tax=Aspergillus versicolor CBS 583.65 TaxID=1036611 RepID=A0A1L9PWR4_ASPVE|nr:uncharacterized protein ASPVEDRAFT_87303 [Aspergillus versicolor CBS 583.65]OJJ05981.1 hypothetical protein ASPVEDRAFT_87303 [Aspergillus versicolor CBS 583.65]
MTRSRKIKSNSWYTKLDNATCLLSFIVNRLPEDAIEGPEAVDQDVEPDADTNHIDDYDDHQNYLEDECCLDIERDKQQAISKLQNNLLDRLAETLARYKSKPGQGGKDAKHVAATMMIPFEEEEWVEIVCAKNEGLDRADEIFLQKWKKCMERMAINGVPSEDDQIAMFDLVFNHQKPRVDTYISWLKRAFERTMPSTSQPFPFMNANFKSITDAYPLARSRSWIDAHDLVYDIPINAFTGEDEQPEAPSIAAALTNIDGPLSRIMDNINTLCGSNKVESARDNTVKCLMKDVFEQWQGIRTRAAIRAYIQCQLSGDKAAQKDAQNALTRLGRVYRCIQTFVHAAEKIPTLKSITITPVRYRPPKNKPGQPGRPPTPIEVARHMGIQTKAMTKHLSDPGERWTNIWDEKQDKYHFHAEIQALQYHDAQLPTDRQQRAHPYVGCSRRNCAFCYLFIQSHRKFAVRGTHESILHRWDVPRCASFEPVIDRLLVTLKDVIQYLLGQVYPIRERELRAQSSKALSSAQLVMEKEYANMERSPRDFLYLGMGRSVMGDRPLIIKLPKTPGYADVSYGTKDPRRRTPMATMTLQDAEVLEENYLRSKAGLEHRGQQPRPTRIQNHTNCRQCGKSAGYRCSACLVRYCSRSCQRKNWILHVFVCCVSNRPNEVDRLRILARQWAEAGDQGDGNVHSQILEGLFADDDLCRAFGFVHCLNQREVGNLMCIYSALVKFHQPRFIQGLIDELKLGKYTAAWVLERKSYGGACNREHQCLSWYTRRLSTGLTIPDWESQYLYQIIAVQITASMFQIDDWDFLNRPEQLVTRLYTILFRSFNNIPTEISAEWINFGFCYCTDRAQTEALADAYISLAESGATLAEIADTWEKETLLDLMETKGIDVSLLRNNQIALHKPPPAEFGAYRLVAEVKHALSGMYCECFIGARYFKSKCEPFLSMESEYDYGFTATNAWERWQLLRFYHRLFSVPGFSAREMQKARHSQDPQALEKYLDSLVPGFRYTILDVHLADGTFPSLGNRVSFRNGLPTCYHIIHPVRTPVGL